VPPVGLVSPSEQFQHHPAIDGFLREGREYECWRSRLFWFWNDGQRDAFDEVVATVQRYLPDALVQPPRLTHDSSPRVLIQFQEDGTDFDISTSGGGLRTLLNLAMVLRFADALCLLLDEPDSHLHGTLQRAVAQMLLDHAVGEDRQVVVASHAPEMISELPEESLVWIDRKQDGGRTCSSIGRVLVDLGALTKADAIRAYGTDKILFVEGSLDRQVLGQLLSTAGVTNPFSDAGVVVAELPSGRGDSVHLAVFRRLLMEALKLDMAVCCVVDNDYDAETSDPPGEPEDGGEVSVFRLRRKEAENYLISPGVIARASASAAERRRQYSGNEVLAPTQEQVEGHLEAVLAGPSVKDTAKYQAIARLVELQPSEQDLAVRLREADEWFETKWADPAWRLANCPGKSVLAALRRWCQEEFGLTLTTATLVESLGECPPDLVEIARGISDRFYGHQNTVNGSPD